MNEIPPFDEIPLPEIPKEWTGNGVPPLPPAENAADSSVKNFHAILKKYWGYEGFRGIQEEIIQSIAAGNDTLGLCLPVAVKVFLSRFRHWL